MSRVEQILHPDWILPIEPAGEVLTGHSIAIDQGHIAAIAPRPTLEDSHQADAVMELPGQVIMPGLVNAHTHAAMTLLRGYADDLPLMTWLQSHIWPAEQAHVGEAFVRDGSTLAILEMLRGGITCFNDMYFFPEITAAAASTAGIRATVGMILIDFPTPYAAGPDEYFDKGQALHAQWANDPLIDTTMAPHAPYTVSEPHLVRAAELAETHGRRMHMHIHETLGEIEASIEKTGSRPLMRLDALGLVGPQLLAVHMTHLDERERDRIRATGAHVIHCPEANLKLASGICPIADLDARGVAIALGTDGAASNNNLDILGEMRTAALLAKGASRDATALPAHRALEMATLGGARAIGRDQVVGSLMVGKAADLISLDLNTPEADPLHDVASQIVYACGREAVQNVWVAGRQVLKNRDPITLDVPAIRARAAEWRDKLRR